MLLVFLDVYLCWFGGVFFYYLVGDLVCALTWESSPSFMPINWRFGLLLVHTLPTSSFSFLFVSLFVCFCIKNILCISTLIPLLIFGSLYFVFYLIHSTLKLSFVFSNWAIKIFHFYIHFNFSFLQYFYIFVECHFNSWIAFVVSVNIVFVFSCKILEHLFCLSSFSLHSSI